MTVVGVVRVQGSTLPPGAVRFRAKSQFTWQKSVYMAPMKYTAMPENSELLAQIPVWLAEDKIELVEE